MAVALNIDLLMGVQETHNHRVRRFGYGDGYEQVAPDGVNTLVREYNITTRPFSQSEYILFKESLESVCIGDTFLVKELTPFISSTEGVHFRLKDNNYSVDYLPASNTFRFSFSLVEAFVN